jgi:SMC interacting uncharacterized protein involved in chromosome segregation
MEKEPTNRELLGAIQEVRTGLRSELLDAIHQVRTDLRVDLMGAIQHSQTELLDVMKGYATDVDSQINGLRGDVNELKQDVGMLKQDVSGLKTHMIGFNVRMDRVEHDVAVIRATLPTLATKNDLKDYVRHPVRPPKRSRP